MPLCIADEEKFLAMDSDFGDLLQELGESKESKWGKKQIKHLVEWFKARGGPYQESPGKRQINIDFEDPNLSLEDQCIRHFYAMRGHRQVMTRCGARGKRDEDGPFKPSGLMISDTPSVLLDYGS